MDVFAVCVKFQVATGCTFRPAAGLDKNCCVCQFFEHFCLSIIRGRQEEETSEPMSDDI